MNKRNQVKQQDVNSQSYFDMLSQGFEGGSFYGLEYILEDFFQPIKVKPKASKIPEIDWFGLYQ